MCLKLKEYGQHCLKFYKDKHTEWLPCVYFELRHQLSNLHVQYDCMISFTNILLFVHVVDKHICYFTFRVCLR